MSSDEPAEEDSRFFKYKTKELKMSDSDDDDEEDDEELFPKKRRAMGGGAAAAPPKHVPEEGEGGPVQRRGYRGQVHNPLEHHQGGLGAHQLDQGSHLRRCVCRLVAATFASE